MDMSSELFFSNIPYDCSDVEFKDWIESSGIETTSIRLIRDLVAGVSPAFGYAVLKDHALVGEAASILNGKKLRGQIITVKPVAARPLGASSSGTMRR
jgi:RNA recognition motif-containing protein